MSHFERIKLNIRNIDHLKEALDALGYRYQTGDHVSVRGYGDQKLMVELTLIIPGVNFQVGFAKNSQGAYEMIADSYLTRGMSPGNLTREIEREIGKIENRIKREIARKTVLENLENQGFTLVSEESGNNEIMLHLRRLV